MRPWGLVISLALLVAPLARAHAKPSATAANPPLPSVKAAPETAAIAAVIEEQFAGFRDTKRSSAVYAADAMIAMTGGNTTPQVNRLNHADGKWTIFGPGTVGKHKVRDLRVVVARDGKSAWASFAAKVSVDGLSKTGALDLRATELFVHGGASWQVRAAAWSIGVATTTLTKAAKQGTFSRLENVFDQNLGDREVIAAVASLAASGLDATAAARADVLGLGPASGELTRGGKLLAAKLTKDWVGKLSLDGATWAVTTGSGTTASATVNVKLARGATKVPARLFAIFEKDTEGAWSPVLVHLAVAPAG